MGTLDSALSGVHYADVGRFAVERRASRRQLPSTSKRNTAADDAEADSDPPSSDEEQDN